MKLKFPWVAALLLLSLLYLAGCDSSRFFEENQEIPGNEWNQNKPVAFTVNLEDTATAYNVYLNIRNAGFYRYSNLYLFINTVFPSGHIQRDTVECVLAAPDGQWLGDGLGDIWDNRILFKEGVHFPQTGEYRFELIQAMRINPLPGIMDAGIRIEKAKTR